MIWDRNEWQGRSEEQVKRNYKVFKYSIIIVSIVIIILYALTTLN